MNEDIYEKYRLAGKIAAEARDFGVSIIEEGVKYLDIAEKIESKIVKSGAGIAFPVNIARNELAAHYSPRSDDNSII